MATILLVVAAFIAFGGAIFHGYSGSKIYMDNDRGRNLSPRTQSLSLVSWQRFTVFLLVSGATLLMVAVSPELALMSYPILLGNGMGSVIFLWLSLTGQVGLIKLPGMYMMFSTAVLGSVGLP